MNCESLFEKFDLFADAPDAVARIRELVVKLAVQGQLSDDANSWREAPLGELLDFDVVMIFLCKIAKAAAINLRS